MTRSNLPPPGEICAVATEFSTLLTGDWRALRPVVTRARCVKCATCWLYCPVQCIQERATWFEPGLATCKGCGICAEECPHHAIAMLEEAE